MRYRKKKSSKPYRNKSPYPSRVRRYEPKLRRGGGHGGPRPYIPSHRSLYEVPSRPAKPELSSYGKTSEHYTISRDRYEPDVERLRLQLSQLQGQMLDMAERKNAEKPEASGNEASESSGILLKEMLDAGIRDRPLTEQDTLEQAEAVFKKSGEDEQARVDSFMDWIEEQARDSHPESFYFDEPEQVATRQVETLPKAELIPAQELPIADLNMLMAELYANPLEAKKEAEIEQTESGNNN